ncbi:MAG TPA: DUF2264 domain-containing protein [Terracidiphilus sp.]|nr:DUF2264 domain-containing protein [Terracidiphilus sp.]
MQSQGNATRRTFLKSALLASAPLLAGSTAQASPTAANAQGRSGKDDRAKWLAIVEQVSQPLLEAVSQQKLHATMPVECANGQEEASRNSTHLQAVGRLLCGLAPWLEAEPGNEPAEEALRTRYREWSRLAIRYGCDPKSPDALNFGNNQQSVVDAAFLALAIVRAPNELWTKLDSTTKDNLVRAMVETRKVQPGFNNWLLFSAIIEAMFCKYGQPWDTMRIDYALRQHQQWYKGDGLYGDGPEFHWDYYNSFVIQPMLLNVLDAVSKTTRRWEFLMRKPVEARARRYAAIQERLISPEGTYPAIGRSLAYRYGAFHHLAEMSLRHQLPEGVHPAQVRCALTAVMSRMNSAKGTFDDKGWLTIGFAGHQPSIGEPYISTGSLYLCSAAWLPLGLPSTDEFWSAPAEPWTQQKAWTGVDIKTDHAIGE